MNTASRLLQTARTRSGLTQTELARRAGVSQSVLSAYERGHREPATKALDRILRAAGYRLGVEPAAVDDEWSGRLLADVLGLIDHLPVRRRPDHLDFPRLPAP